MKKIHRSIAPTKKSKPNDKTCRCIQRKRRRGGIFEVVAVNVVVGLGSHTSGGKNLTDVSRKPLVNSTVKAVEIGEGVANAGRFGSKVHDEIIMKIMFSGEKQPCRRTRRRNTNGEELRVAIFKTNFTIKKGASFG